MLEPPGTPWQGSSARTSSGRVPRRWVALARSAWIVCALLLLANFVASIPAYYKIMLTVCTLPNHVPCTMPGQPDTISAQLTPDNVAALAHLHLSLATYAASVVTVDVVLSLLYWGVGLLLFWRKSDEGMGLFVSLLLVLYGGTGIQGFFLGAYAPTPSPLLLQILLFLISAAQWTGLFAFLLIFPTGRFVPRWSWLIILLSDLSFLVFNPGLFSGWAPVLNAPVVSAAVNLLELGGPLAIMVCRYVRVFNAVQRQQVKWFVYAVASGLALGVIVAALPAVTPFDSPFQLVSAPSGPLALAFIPLGLGVAILRYRLWDIDVIINRTLVYGPLTTLLALLYVGLIVALQALLRGMFNQNNDVAIVVSTLVIAALFQPLRRWIQRIIDRRFYRRKYDAARTLAAFSATLRHEVDLATLSEHLVAIVEETMQPAHVSLWLRKDEQRRKPDIDA
ncbi:MAG TPA: hypothetical protein VIZ18_07085 [Ktedonobacteraceae bacterium]